MIKNLKGRRLDKIKMENLDIEKNGLKLSEIYNSPMVDLVCSIFGTIYPPISIMKEGINVIVNDFQEKKRKQFCDIILSGQACITSDKVKDVTFIVELSRTIDVINRLAQNDKVIYIAKLFKKEFVEAKEYDVDRYEEYLHRLDYMSLKEIDLLIDLYNYEEKNSKPNHEEWYDFKVLASKKYKISDDEVVSIFDGLTRSGFCRQSNMLFPSDKDIENPFYVTTYLKKLIQIILAP